RDVLFVADGGRLAHLADGQVVRGVPAGGEALPAWPRWRAGRTPWIRWGYLPLCGLLALTAAACGLARRRAERRTAFPRARVLG
ncbi:MAG TPA: hypothetical protein VGC20_05530, partial [bacterium]